MGSKLTPEQTQWMEQAANTLSLQKIEQGDEEKKQKQLEQEYQQKNKQLEGLLGPLAKSNPDLYAKVNKLLFGARKFAGDMKFAEAIVALNRGMELAGSTSSKQGPETQGKDSPETEQQPQKESPQQSSQAPPAPPPSPKQGPQEVVGKDSPETDQQPQKSSQVPPPPSPVSKDSPGTDQQPEKEAPQQSSQVPPVPPVPPKQEPQEVVDKDSPETEQQPQKEPPQQSSQAPPAPPTPPKQEPQEVVDKDSPETEQQPQKDTPQPSSQVPPAPPSPVSPKQEPQEVVDKDSPETEQQPQKEAPQQSSQVPPAPPPSPKQGPQEVVGKDSPETEQQPQKESAPESVDDPKKELHKELEQGVPLQSHPETDPYADPKYKQDLKWMAAQLKDLTQQVKAATKEFDISDVAAMRSKVEKDVANEYQRVSGVFDSVFNKLQSMSPENEDKHNQDLQWMADQLKALTAQVKAATNEFDVSDAQALRKDIEKQVKNEYVRVTDVFDGILEQVKKYSN